MKVLIGVFDWGLGHATRTMPVVETLLRQGHDVDFIATGRALTLLRQKFGDSCVYHDVPGMLPKAFASKSFVLSYALNTPRMLSQLRDARVKSLEIVSEGYDVVMSDCRYDVYDKPENSFLVTHQLQLKSPFMQFIPAMILGRMARSYGGVIVPDYPGAPLSGELANDKYYSMPVHRVGVLSQLSKHSVKQDVDYFISLSGPEPGRTKLYESVMPQLAQLDGKIVIAGGKPEENRNWVRGNVSYYSFLRQKQQEQMMNRARTVVTRSGYTTVMDLVELGKKHALFIPTPGQTEQEYLADLYEEKKYFHHVHQKDLSLVNDLRACRSFSGFAPPWRTRESVRKCIKVLKG